MTNVQHPLNRVKQALLRIALEHHHGTPFHALPLYATFFCLAPGFTTETLRKVEPSANETNAESLDGSYRAVIPKDWLVVPEEARSSFFDTPDAAPVLRPFLTISQRTLPGVPR